MDVRDRHPAIVWDLSVRMPIGLPYGPTVDTIRAASPLVESVQLVDRYDGDGIPPGQIGLSYRLTFRASNRTLTRNEAQDEMNRIRGVLAIGHQAVPR